MLMHVDHLHDSIESLCERIRAKFEIKPEVTISRLLLCPSGEIIDDVQLIEKNDKIEVELVILSQDHSGMVYQNQGFNFE